MFMGVHPQWPCQAMGYYSMAVMTVLNCIGTIKGTPHQAKNAIVGTRVSNAVYTTRHRCTCVHVMNSM